VVHAVVGDVDLGGVGAEDPLQLVALDGTMSRAARRAAVRIADLKNMALTWLYSSGSVKKVTSWTVTTVGLPGRSGIE
jgi:hypothetical protein